MILNISPRGAFIFQWFIRAKKQAYDESVFIPQGSISDVSYSAKHP
jgi:hypothetical protein